MKPDEVDFVAEVGRAGAGLKVDREKVYLIESRLAPVARREGFGSIREMLLAARQRREERLLWAVLEALASGETSFFRDKPLFTRLREEILPTLARHRQGEGPLRIWSAGCATGQEAYSVALTVEDSSAVVGAEGVEILGTDISERALEKALAGAYTQFDVQRGLPIRQLVRHFEKREDLWTISPRIRSMVRWKRVNLNGDCRGLGQFDLILCRNVVWAMEPHAARRLLEQLAGALAPGGRLVLGAGETAGGLAEAFIPCEAGVFEVNPAFRAAA